MDNFNSKEIKEITYLLFADIYSTRTTSRFSLKVLIAFFYHWIEWKILKVTHISTLTTCNCFMYIYKTLCIYIYMHIYVYIYVHIILYRYVFNITSSIFLIIYCIHNSYFSFLFKKNVLLQFFFWDVIAIQHCIYVRCTA